jgi:surface protein
MLRHEHEHTWNVSRVTSTSLMFDRAASFNQPLDAWNVSNVTDMRNMFVGAIAFNQPLSPWDVIGVENIPAVIDVGCESRH